MEKRVNPTKVITSKNVVMSYLNVNQPKAAVEGATPKYSVSLIIRKDDELTINRIKAAIEAAYKEGESKLKGNGKTVPPLASFKSPLRDGDIDRAGDENYKGCYFVNANSTTKPGVVDVDLQEIVDPAELYSGIIGRASINFYAFNTGMSKGIACGLNNIQKIKDGTHLGGKASAEQDFSDDEDDDDFLG